VTSGIRIKIYPIFIHNTNIFYIFVFNNTFIATC